MKTTTKSSHGTARLSLSTTESGAQALTIWADWKVDAQEALRLAKTWIWANGGKLKLVFFYEHIGTQWSSIGRSYQARIVFKTVEAA